MPRAGALTLAAALLLFAGAAYAAGGVWQVEVPTEDPAATLTYEGDASLTALVECEAYDPEAMQTLIRLTPKPLDQSVARTPATLSWVAAGTTKVLELEPGCGDRACDDPDTYIHLLKVEPGVATATSLATASELVLKLPDRSVTLQADARGFAAFRDACAKLE